MPNKTDLKAIAAELVTIRDLLRWALSQFYHANLYYGHGTDNAWDEALYLVLASLHLPPDLNPAVLEAKLLLTERLQIVELIEKRVNQRLPVAYLTQQAWFAGLSFYIDQRVIIPRSPLAELIEKGFEPWVDSAALERVLDLCTGSGCIAIACAINLPFVSIDAIDISSQALEITQINIARHQVQEQVRAIQSDLFAAIPDQVYDLIISNPPYVGKAELANLPSEYHHEPELALAGGDEEGLAIVITILREASKHLTAHGILIVEVGNSQAALIERFPTVPFVWLEFARGGDGVFLLTADQLEEYKPLFQHETKLNA